MIDSTNPRVMADNIRILSVNQIAQGAELESKIEALQIFDDAATETGMKWIDGKPIYRIVFEGTSPTEGNVDFPLDYDTIVNLYGFYVTSAGATNYITRSANLFGNLGTSIRLSTASASSYQGVNCYIIVEYTLPDPTPDVSPDPDSRSLEEEPELEPEEPINEELKKEEK